jgi:hypothetical protein
MPTYSQTAKLDLPTDSTEWAYDMQIGVDDLIDTAEKASKDSGSSDFKVVGLSQIVLEGTTVLTTLIWSDKD